MFRPKVTEVTPRLFKSDFLELLSRTHPSVVVMLYLPIVIWLLWYSIVRAGVGPWQSGMLFVVGAIGWTFAEYWLHRTIMHWIPELKWGPRMHFWVHGIHHELPHDPLRLVMPPAISLSLFFIFLGLFSLFMGRYLWAFHAGFTFGYIIYDLSHFLMHHSKPRYQWVKDLQRHHLLHHFNAKYDDLRFSITVPIWDKLFGTLEPKSNQERKTSQNS